jgi:hypothetical protein
LVSVNDSALDPMAEVTDLMFSASDMDTRRIQHVAGELYVLSRDASSSEFRVYAGTVSGPPWRQVGATILQAPSDIWINGDVLYLLVSREDVNDLACRQLPVTATETTPWEPCPGTFAYQAESYEKPYSVQGKFTSDGNDVAAWWKVKGLDLPMVALFAPKAGQWQRISQIEMADPAAWYLHEGVALFGFVGQEAGAPLKGISLEGAVLEDFGRGLPQPKDKFSGVMGICAASGGLYVLYLDYASTNSKLTVYRGE